MKELADHLRQNANEVLRRWLARVEKLPGAKNRPTEELRDHIPEILERVASAVEVGTRPEDLAEYCEKHAEVRLRAGFDIRQVVEEYQHLRQVIMEVLEEAPQNLLDRPGFRGVVALNTLIDSILAETTSEFMRERDRSREIFLGVLGHDIRNPLNVVRLAIVGFLEKSDDLDPDRLRAATRADRAVRRIENMMNDLLEFARGRLGGSMPVAPEPMDLAELVAQVVEEVSTVHPRRDVRVLEPKPGESFQGAWDARRLAQVVTNLVENAVRHGQDPVRVGIRALRDAVAIEVSNRGEIPGDVHAARFEPFALARKEQGSGLGLYIAEQIARAHGGDIEVESEDEVTLFRLRLPRHTHAVEAA